MPHFLTFSVGLAENMTHKKVKGIIWLQDKQSISDKGMQVITALGLACSSICLCVSMFFARDLPRLLYSASVN